MTGVIRRLLATAVAASAAFLVSATPPARPHAHAAPVSCAPVGGSEGQLGCWVLGSLPVTASDAPLFWHVTEYPSLRAAQAAGNAGGWIGRAYGRIWLLAVAPRQWTAKGGRTVATVGPLDTLSSAPHTATFMEATFEPGMRSEIHTHPGPEAWVVLAGEQCLETSDGTIRVRKGKSMMVRGGIPMALYGTGTKTRRALVLILHPSDQRPTTPETGWQPKGTCLAG